MAEPNLFDAANHAYANLQVLWIADTLRTACITFASTANLIFDEQNDQTHPISNWIAVIASNAPLVKPFEQTPNVSFGSIDKYQAMVTYVFRLCRLASYFQDQGFISTSQANALLAAYNDNFT